MTNIDFFDTIGNRPTTWEYKADSLLLAANVLTERHATKMSKYDKNDEIKDKDGWTVGNKSPVLKYTSLTWTSNMLVAFSIECYIKSVWVARGNTLAKDGNYKPMMKKEAHDLEKMYEHLGFTASKQERSVLKRLTIVSTGMGRYPIQTKHTKGEFPGRQESEGMRWNNREDGNIVNEIIEKLKKEINST
ncbi:MAG: hypothetical protein JKX73_10525 [Flavobacteriales bacterium]|nr:hypothetical protein [Flavobacteriales bacterium]